MTCSSGNWAWKWCSRGTSCTIGSSEDGVERLGGKRATTSSTGRLGRFGRVVFVVGHLERRAEGIEVGKRLQMGVEVMSVVIV